MVEACGLLSQCHVLARSRVKLLDRLQPPPQAGYLLSTGSGSLTPLAQPLGGILIGTVGLGIGPAPGQVLGPAQAVQGGALGRRAAQAELVSLAMNRDELGSHL